MAEENVVENNSLVLYMNYNVKVIALLISICFFSNRFFCTLKKIVPYVNFSAIIITLSLYADLEVTVKKFILLIILNLAVISAYASAKKCNVIFKTKQTCDCSMNSSGGKKFCQCNPGAVIGTDPSTGYWGVEGSILSCKVNKTQNYSSAYIVCSTQTPVWSTVSGKNTHKCLNGSTEKIQ